MSDWPYHPEDMKQLVRFARSLLDCTQEELARKAGLDPSTVSRYEAGKVTPSRKNLEAIVSTARLSLPFVEACLLPAFTAARAASATLSPKALEGLEPAGVELGRALAGIGRSAVTAFLTLAGTSVEERSQPSGIRPSEEDRLKVSDLVYRLEACTVKGQLVLVETRPEFRQWPIAEWLCHKSAEAASNSASQALELARLACWIARRVPGDERWRARVEGYVLLFVSNALRVANRMRGAERAFVRGMKLWETGLSADPGLLAEWRLLDLEGSLRRDQRQFSKALAALERALASAPSEAKARILLKKAFTLEQSGEAEAALATLRIMASFMAVQHEPRLLFGLNFNWIACLCRLRRYEEAEEMLPQTRDLAMSLKKDLDLLRVVWLSGRIAAGLGREGEAQAAWNEVRREFTKRGMAYDYALVTLELAVLLLDQGHNAEVRSLAGETLWIFEANGIHREALAALEVFRTAAARERLTLDLTRRILAYLERARKDPGLRFDA